MKKATEIIHDLRKELADRALRINAVGCRVV